MRTRVFQVSAWLLAFLFAGQTAFAQAVPASVEERIKALEQELALLKRTIEVDREVAFNKNKTAPVITATTGKEGFSIKSPDGNFKLKLGGLSQADARYFLDSNEDIATDTFLLRRTRLIFDGTLYKYFDFRIMPDFGGGTTVLQDAYVDFNYWKQFKIRAGKFREPFGLERLQSAANLLFVERGLPNNLVPNRDIGAQIFGDVEVGDALVGYALGVFNGVADGGSADSDLNNDKDLAARVFVEPFKNSDITALNGLGVGMAGTYGESKGRLPTYRTPAQGTVFSYASGTTSDGYLYRWSPQAYYYNGPFGGLAEYVVSDQDLNRTTASEHVRNQGWQIAGSWVVTGENASYNGVKPLTPFLTGDGLGAWELKARLGGLHIDNNAFSGGFANAATSAERAIAWAVGVNWYLNSNLKWMLDFEQTDFQGGGMGFGPDREKENALLSRFQFAF